MKSPVSEGNWVSWCTFEGIDYPQKVKDVIDSLHSENDNSSSDSTEHITDET